MYEITINTTDLRNYSWNWYVQWVESISSKKWLNFRNSECEKNNQFLYPLHFQALLVINHPPSSNNENVETRREKKSYTIYFCSLAFPSTSPLDPKPVQSNTLVGKRTKLTRFPLSIRFILYYVQCDFYSICAQVVHL